jgi:hypothetical protein
MAKKSKNLKSSSSKPNTDKQKRGGKHEKWTMNNAVDLSKKLSGTDVEEPKNVEVKNNEDNVVNDNSKSKNSNSNIRIRSREIIITTLVTCSFFYLLPIIKQNWDHIEPMAWLITVCLQLIYLMKK